MTTNRQENADRRRNGRGGESAIVPTVLRLGVVVLFVIGQARSRPGFGLTGEGLVITLLTVAVAVALLVAILLPQRGDSPPPSFLGVPVKIVAFCLAVLCAVGLDTMANDGPAIAVLIFAAGAAAVRHPFPHSLPVGALGLAGLLTAGAITGDMDRALSLAFSLCLVFLIAYSIRQRRAVRNAEGREAVLAERARIAREIHDILAHSLSAQIVHLEGARLLLRADRSQEALDRVERARDLAKNGLEEARRAVSALREDLPPLPAALRALAEEFRAVTGRECTLLLSGRERRLPPETELAVIRTAQEAITNVRRHAPGSAATVRLGFHGGSCELEVTNPAGDSPGTPGGGYGIMGMRERAELLGGTLEAGESGDVFRIRLRVPS
ncbi:sensor histidine kinase [Streptosporangium sp. NPDC051022]|uniref:sensor histidine kinase n=1 Tax=Streptosporangium sp. NPDC051022 TaxID=3155752 RepID=UPI00341EF0EC